MTDDLVNYDDIDTLEFELKRNAEAKRDMYVNNKELYAEFVDYHERCKKAGEKLPLTNKIGHAILAISERRAYSRNYLNYTNAWKEEMIGDAVDICCRYVHNFNPEKSNNPFAYITQLVNNAYIQRIKREKRQVYLKSKMIVDSGAFIAGDEDGEVLEHFETDGEVYNNALRFVADYEQRAGEEGQLKRERKEESTFNLGSLFE